MRRTARPNGITFCQGNFAAMDNVDLPAAIRRFGARKKLFFSRCRDAGTC